MGARWVLEAWGTPDFIARQQWGIEEELPEKGLVCMTTNHRKGTVTGLPAEPTTALISGLLGLVKAQYSASPGLPPEPITHDDRTFPKRQ